MLWSLYNFMLCHLRDHISPFDCSAVLSHVLPRQYAVSPVKPLASESRRIESSGTSDWGARVFVPLFLGPLGIGYTVHQEKKKRPRREASSDEASRQRRTSHLETACDRGNPIRPRCAINNSIMQHPRNFLIMKRIRGLQTRLLGHGASASSNGAILNHTSQDAVVTNSGRFASRLGPPLEPGPSDCLCNLHRLNHDHVGSP